MRNEAHRYPFGNCRVYVESEQAREFLNDLLSLAGTFKAQEGIHSAQTISV